MEAIPLVLAGAGALGSAQQTRTAGKIAKGQSKVQARQAELGAIQREGDRKSRLADALASQSASAGARGIAGFQGSPLTILNEDIAREDRATQRDKFSTELEAFSIKARGKQANLASRSKAITGLISAGSEFASVIKTKKTTVPKKAKV